MGSLTPTAKLQHKVHTGNKCFTWNVGSLAKPALLSDAKLPKDFSQQIIWCEFSGNGCKCSLRQPQLLGEQFKLHSRLLG